MFRKSLARKKVQNIQKHFPAAAKVSPKSHRSAPYFPPNPLISPAPGTQTVIATIGFHFLCNWTRNGAGDKKGTFSNTCYLVFQQRRARQRLWFVQFAKFAKHCLPPKSCEPANAILPFPFRPPAAASQPPHIHIYLNLFVSFGLQLSFPGSQKFRSKWRNPISVITWFVICGVLLLREPFTGNGCEKIQFLFFCSSRGKLGKNASLDSHQWLSTIRARCGRLVNTVFSGEGGEGGGCGGSWCENRASSSYQLFYSRPASARLTLWTVGW